MIIDPIAIIFFTVTVSVLAGVIFFLARSYAKTAEKLHDLEEANRKQISVEPVKLLEEAHRKSQELLIRQTNKQMKFLQAVKSTRTTPIRH